jgi:tRNA dimethylallyltransferase
MSLADLLARAEKLGLDTAGIDRRNKRRVIRLIENNGQSPTKQALRANTLVLGPKVPSAELTTRIEQRVDAMLEAGLADEVRRLAERYGWQVEPMKGIGYKEWQGYFEGAKSLEEVRQQIIKNTKDLAKRQRTWFKRNSFIHWLDNRDEIEQAVALATTKLNK